MAQKNSEVPMWNIPGYESSIDLYGGTHHHQSLSLKARKKEIRQSLETLGADWLFLDGSRNHTTEIWGKGDLLQIKTLTPGVSARWSRAYGELRGVSVRLIDVLREAFVHGVDVGNDLVYLTEMINEGIKGVDEAVTLAFTEGVPTLFKSEVGSPENLSRVSDLDFLAEKTGFIPGRANYAYTYSREGMMGFVNLDVYPQTVVFSYTDGVGTKKALMVFPREVMAVPVFDRIVSQRMPSEEALICLIDELLPEVK